MKICTKEKEMKGKKMMKTISKKREASKYYRRRSKNWNKEVKIRKSHRTKWNEKQNY